MTEVHADTPPSPVPAPEAETGQQIGLADSFIREIRELLEEGYTDRIQELCHELPPPDVAELLSKTDSATRRKLVDIIEDGIDPESFLYLDEDILNEVLGEMSALHVAAIVDALDSDDAITIINGLDEARRADIMRHLSRRVRAAVEEGLSFPEYTAGRLMQREFVAVPRFWTVGKAVDYLRAAAEALPDKFYDVFIVDAQHGFAGSVALSRLLCAQRPIKIETLAEEDHTSIPIAMDQEEIAHLFRRKDLLSAPVVNEDGKLVGMITVDDIVDIIDEEAEEDFLKMGGVRDTDIFRPVVTTARSRFSWLAVNLLTAVAASLVIRLFEDSIEKVVALAILMPIVASMGGNAGTQALSVAIRALATKELSAANANRVIGKETIVGLINGLLFAVLMGLIVWGWFGNPALGIVIAAAMVVNLVAAGLFGALIPVALDKLGRDPAPASGVLLTTVTDVVGFFAFLGLATLFLL